MCLAADNYKLVFAFAMKIKSKYPSVPVNEIVGNLWVPYLQAIKYYDPAKGSVSNFIYKCLYNATKYAMSKELKHSRVKKLYDVEEQGKEDKIGALDWDKLEPYVNRCLSGQEKYVFMQHYKMGVNYRKLADEFNCTHQNMSCVGKKALHRLQGFFKHKEMSLITIGNVIE